MSTQTVSPPWSSLRTGWYLVLVFVTMLFVQLPMYFYFYKLSELNQRQYIWLILSAPVFAAAVLTLVTINLVDFFWRRERIEKNRKLAIVAPRALLGVSVAYVLLLYVIILHLLHELGLNEIIQDSPGSVFMLELTTVLALMLFFSRLLAVPRDT